MEAPGPEGLKRATPSTEQTKILLTIVSTFGLGAIFVVVVGRLWTIAYFEYFGLSTGDLEFSIEDFAFRSLEVFISISLAAVVIVVGWRARRFPVSGPFQAALFFVAEAALIGLAFVWLYLGLAIDKSWLAQTGVLGIFGGLALSLTLLPVANVLFDADDEEAAVVSGRMADRIKENSPKIVAAFWMIAIFFVFIPLGTEYLARAEAKLDLDHGKLAVAILTTEDNPPDPLPVAVASDADPTQPEPGENWSSLQPMITGMRQAPRFLRRPAGFGVW